MFHSDHNSYKWWLVLKGEMISLFSTNNSCWKRPFILIQFLVSAIISGCIGLINIFTCVYKFLSGWNRLMYKPIFYSCVLNTVRVNRIIEMDEVKFWSIDSMGDGNSEIYEALFHKFPLHTPLWTVIKT